jgi:hypothetical protein
MGVGFVITVYTSDRVFSAADVQALPRSCSGTCWVGESLSVRFSWCFALDPHCLWFFCEVEGGASYSTSRAAREFVEGLWEEDVGEFFVRDSSGRYQEFNLAPSGAWWSAVFDSYRRRAEVSPRPTILEVHTEVSSGSWRGLLGIQRESMAIQVREGSSLHVSGIVYAPKCRYLSSCPDRSVEPDFHRSACFQPVSLVPARAANLG